VANQILATGQISVKKKKIKNISIYRFQQNIGRSLVDFNKISFGLESVQQHICRSLVRFNKILVGLESVSTKYRSIFNPFQQNIGRFLVGFNKISVGL